MSDAEMSDEEILAQARRDYAADLAEYERDHRRRRDDMERFAGKIADFTQRIRDRAAHDPAAHIELCRIVDRTERDGVAKLEALDVSPAARSLVTSIAQIGRALLGLPPSQEFLNRLYPAEPTPPSVTEEAIGDCQSKEVLTLDGWAIRVVRIAPDPTLGEADVFAGFGAWLTDIETGESPLRDDFERKNVPAEVPDFSGFETAELAMTAVRDWVAKNPRGGHASGSCVPGKDADAT